ncbi:hypothetical protein [Stieleria mannarensis]|uniref:hypothetical protein n=1 Tax=Stieleria mannarensis TaxID=2755585 RepID=UPI00160321DD|nr:hypothetical protein [Rhodopirellula sp. JC639]
MTRITRLTLWTLLLVTVLPAAAGCSRHTGLSGNSGDIADYLSRNPGSDLGTQVEGGDR